MSTLEPAELHTQLKRCLVFFTMFLFLVPNCYGGGSCDEVYTQPQKCKPGKYLQIKKGVSKCVDCPSGGGMVCPGYEFEGKSLCEGDADEFNEEHGKCNCSTTTTNDKEKQQCLKKAKAGYDISSMSEFEWNANDAKTACVVTTFKCEKYSEHEYTYNVTDCNSCSAKCTKIVKCDPNERGRNTSWGNVYINTETFEVVGKFGCSTRYHVPDRSTFINRIKQNTDTISCCESCANDYDCPGDVVVTEIKDVPQGITKNEVHYKNWENGSVNQTFTVAPSCEAGNVYVHANSKCVRCDSNPEWVKIAQEGRLYCPGGLATTTDNKGNVINIPPLKQVKKCPLLQEPNEDLSGCRCMYKGKMEDGKCKITSISYLDLYYGPLKDKGAKDSLFKQCWTKRDRQSYRRCMGFDN